MEEKLLKLYKLANALGVRNPIIEISIVDGNFDCTVRGMDLNIAKDTILAMSSRSASLEEVLTEAESITLNRIKYRYESLIGEVENLTDSLTTAGFDPNNI